MAALVVPALGALGGAALIPAGVLPFGLTGGGVGWFLGSMVASSMQTQKSQGPRLSDLTVSDSSYGTPIPYIIGHPRVACQWIWASKKREISTTTSRRAKGGPKVQNTSFTYEVDLMGKLSCNRMAGVRRIWIDSELQWTSAGDADYGSIKASSQLARRITIYRGDDDQMPDPTFEADVGIGNAPAHTAALTIMFEGMQLGTQGRIPVVTCEVVDEAIGVVNQVTLQTDPYANHFARTDDGGTSYATRVGATNNFDVFFVPNGATKQYQRTVAFPATYRGDGSGDRLVLVGTLSFFDARVLVSFADGQPLAELTDIAPPGSSASPRYFIRGDDIVVSAAGNLARYDLSEPGTGGAPTAGGSNATYAPIVKITAPTTFSRHVIIDDRLYSFAANLGVKTVYEYDLETLTVLSTFSTPAVSGTAEPITDDLGRLLLVDQLRVYSWNGTTWDTLLIVNYGYGAVGASGDITGNATFPAYLDDVLTTMFPDPGGNALYLRASWPAVNLQDIPLNVAVQRLWARAGLDLSGLDASALSGQSVRAFAITPSTTRSVLETLSQAYQFECCPTGSQMRMVPLGGAAVAVIPWEDLGTEADGNLPDNPLPLSVRNDIEMPAFITVKYMNVNNDYQDGAERSARITTYSEAEQFIEFPLGMTPAEAKRCADYLANFVEASLNGIGPIALQTKWTTLMPGDPIIVTDQDGSTFRMRVQQRDDSNGIIVLTGVGDNQSVATSLGLTSEDYFSSSQIRTLQITLFNMGDWPLLRDGDDDIGYYWAARSAGSFWKSAVLLRSIDDVVYEPVSNITDQTVLGNTVTALPDYAGLNIPDEAARVRVRVNGTLASITWDEMLSQTKNAFMIGRELVIAREVTYVSDGVYDLSGLLRGRRGTEWAQTGHVANEPVTLLQTSGIRRVASDLTELNLMRYFRAITEGMSLDSAPAKTFTNTGVSAIPYAPTNLDAERNATQLTLFWNRRTRYAENWLAGLVPLGEATELWSIQFYTDGTYSTPSGAPVTSTTASVTVPNVSPAYVGVRQISDRVGPGYEARGTF